MNYIVVIIAAAAWMALAPHKQHEAVSEIRSWLADTNANPVQAITYTNASGAYLVASYSAAHVTNYPSIADAARLAQDYGVELVATRDPAGMLASRNMEQAQ